MTRPHGPAGCRTFLFRFSIHPLLERLRLYFFHTFCGWHLCPPTINKPADAPLRGVAGLSCCTSARFHPWPYLFCILASGLPFLFLPLSQALLCLPASICRAAAGMGRAVP